MTAQQFLLSGFGGIAGSALYVWAKVWWIFLPLITFLVFWDFWVLYIQYRFIIAIQWVLLEIKVPKNVMKTPKAMEQIFAAAHAPYSYGLRFLEKYWEGRVEYWMSFELVGSAGEMHFYLRTPKRYRNLMESAIYGQYPDAEVVEVEGDYLKEIPGPLPNKYYDLYGSDMVLKEANPYPIRTYVEFDEPIEERQVDTIAAITEVMSKLKADEHVWIQILARSTGDDWKKEGEKLIDKIAGKEKKKKSGPPLFGVALQDAVLAPVKHPPLEPAKKKDERQVNFKFLNPVEQDMVKAISTKVGKLGFQTTVRFLYIDRRDAFSRDNASAVIGYFRQFNTQNLNLFRPDKRTMTAAVHGLFKKTRLEYRKRVIWEKFRDLSFNPKKPILNIEELATIYHFPIMQVTAAELERLPSRKGSPPPGLPLAE